MKLPYSNEIGALAETYEQALRADIAPFRQGLELMGSGPALFVGSGGSMAIAELASFLHERKRRQPARACTSLDALAAPQLLRRGALLFSSSAKHPDAQRVLRDFQRGRFSPAVLVTHRDVASVQQTAGPDTVVVPLPPLVQPDGFLATGSILQLATLTLRCYAKDDALPSGLETGDVSEAPLRDEVLVLTPPSLRSVAIDLEVRLVESGLAAVQVNDYRNFAHGRHTGFARRSERVSVIALSANGSEALATGTVDALPRESDVRRWHVEGAWEKAIVTLLQRSMSLAGATGDRVGLDIARPTVPAFGRRLYRLPLTQRVPSRLTGGVERKLLASGTGDDPAARAFYQEAGSAWSEQISAARFAAVVLDYDGTVCWTHRRFELPEARLRERLTRILEGGSLVGFASGRGRSVHADLRQWVPEAFWDRVTVGLYSGGLIVQLAEDLPDLRKPTDWSQAVTATVKDIPHAGALEIVERGLQVSVTVRGSWESSALKAAISDGLQTSELAGIVVTSGHSVDIVPTGSSKLAVVAHVEDRGGGLAVAIGDQGQLGGNDHAMLSRGPYTLSVDRCSPAPDSCWFLGPGDRVGPALLERYLYSLRSRRGGLALTGTELR